MTDSLGAGGTPKDRSLEDQQREQYQAVLQRVIERVWQLWMADLRRDQEQRGQRRNDS